MCDIICRANNPPICEGGRNIPEHLYVYHPATHKLIHNTQAINWAKKSKGNTTEKRGKPLKKTEPTQQELLKVTPVTETSK